MPCKHFKKRINKGEIYFYCSIKKEKIEYSNCKYCEYKEYKQYKPMNLRTNKQSKRERERFSIIYPDLTKCCICGSKTGVEKNEIFEGAYRQLSIKYGMVCPFCKIHHELFHKNRLFNLEFKTLFQKKFMETYSLDDFINIFKQDFICKLEKFNKQ